MKARVLSADAASGAHVFQQKIASAKAQFSKIKNCNRLAENHPNSLFHRKKILSTETSKKSKVTISKIETLKNTRLLCD